MIQFRKKLVGISILILIICLSVLFIVRYNSLNNKYPPATTVQYQINEPVKYSNFEITMTGYKMMDKAELQELGSIYDNIKYDNKDIKSIVTTIKISNTSNKSEVLEVYPFTLESVGFSNGINFELFLALNGENKTLNPQLKAGDEVELHLPFTLIEKQFTKLAWTNIPDRQFELVLSLYPEKKSIIIGQNIQKNLY